MTELLTILAIGLALECLFCWAFPCKPVDERAKKSTIIEAELVNGCLVCNAKQGEECKDGYPVGCRFYKPERRPPIMSIKEILPRCDGQRNFRVIADSSASPIEMEPYLPFCYGSCLQDDPSRIATDVLYQRERQADSQAVWRVSYKFTPIHVI